MGFSHVADCTAVQAALSARLDGEPTGMDGAVIDAHLAHCSNCRLYYDRAAELNRKLNLGVAEPRTMVPPDLSEIILAEVEPQWRRRANTRVIASTVLRILLVILGAVYTVWAASMLGDTVWINIQDDPLTVRLIGEAATFRLGLAVGLFFAAWKPQIIPGMLPVFGALWTFNLGFAARDLVFGIADSTTAATIVLSLISAVVLGLTWLNSRGAGVLRRTWGSLNATPM